MIPRPGDYIVVRTTGIVSTLICWITRSKFCHAAIVIEDGQLVEAEPGGVRLAAIEEYDGCWMMANTLEPTSDEQRATVVAYARAHLGEPYNFDADAVDGLDHLGLRWKFLGRFAAARKAVMCSQLVADAGVAAGLTAWRCGKTTTADVVPGDLAARIEKRQWT
jgi:uncharacterized protein YycO